MLFAERGAANETAAAVTDDLHRPDHQLVGLPSQAGPLQDRGQQLITNLLSIHV
jgi:hypothetical protein